MRCTTTSSPSPARSRNRSKRPSAVNVADVQITAYACDHNASSSSEPGCIGAETRSKSSPLSNSRRVVQRARGSGSLDVGAVAIVEQQRGGAARAIDVLADDAEPVFGFVAVLPAALAVHHFLQQLRAPHRPASPALPCLSRRSAASSPTARGMRPSGKRNRWPLVIARHVFERRGVLDQVDRSAWRARWSTPRCRAPATSVPAAARRAAPACRRSS